MVSPIKLAPDVTTPDEQKEKLIKGLENLLEEIKNNKILGLVILRWRSDGAYGWINLANDDLTVTDLVGKLEMIKLEVAVHNLKYNNTI